MAAFSKQAKEGRLEAGTSLIEILLAGTILTICSLGMIALIVTTIGTNSRNKINSTQTMLAQSIIEHVGSTMLGTAGSSISDCAGNTYTIGSLAGGANLNADGNEINFTENIAGDVSKTDYHMDYYLNTPCTSTGARQAVYDVRWNVLKVGGVSNPTNTYLLTVSARLKSRADGGLLFPRPVTLRFMSGI